MFIQESIDRLEFGAARLVEHVAPFDDEPSDRISCLGREQASTVPTAAGRGKGLLQKRMLTQIRVG